MKIAIVGGGIVGLTAAFFLGQKGHEVVVYEKERSLGGLAACFKEEGWDWPLEKFYHHFFSTDKEIADLAKILGIENLLFFRKPKTSVLIKEKIYRFDSPFSILLAPFLNLSDKIRVGVISGLLKTNPFWKPLEKVTAAFWLKKYYGEKVYQLLWEPLLVSKFGKEAERISAAWFWARIKKRTTSLGYFEGSTEILIEKLAEKIKKNKGKIFLNTEVANIKKIEKFDKILVTTSPQVFLKIASDLLPRDYQNFLKGMKTIGALSLVLILKEKFLTDGTYWLNITSKDFPFVALVEHTNFIEPDHYDGNHVVYVGGYYPENHSYFKMKEEDLLKEFIPFLIRINPRLKLKKVFLSKSFFAQPVIPCNYSEILPSFSTPVPNLFFACMHHIYPWDRGVNYAIETGKKVASFVS